MTHIPCTEEYAEQKARHHAQKEILQVKLRPVEEQQGRVQQEQHAIHAAQDLVHVEYEEVRKRHLDTHMKGPVVVI
jgi:hypothetical protein